MALDESRRFLPVNIAVLTVSDTRALATDRSGQTLVELIERDGHRVVARHIVKDGTYPTRNFATLGPL